MKITFEDTKLIRDCEGYRSTAYLDTIANPPVYTIAWGLTGAWVTKGLVLSPEDAKTRFMDRIGEIRREIDDVLKVQLTKNQYIAILSFTYNLGINSLKRSTLLVDLNKGDYLEASKCFTKWVYSNKKFIPGLLGRREKERDLFLLDLQSLV